MASMLLILKASPEHEQHAHFLVNLAQAAVDQGHSVTTYVYGDGVYYLVDNFGVLKKDLGPDIAGIVNNEKVNLICCNFNAIQRGVANHITAAGVAKVSTTDAAMEFLRNEKLVFISQ